LLVELRPRVAQRSGACNCASAFFAPGTNHRFDYSLPAPDWYSGWEFVKALFIPNNGRYRLIALVVSKEPLREKPEEMTHNEVEEINRGPSGLGPNDWASLEVTPDYVFRAYIYEFYRKTREDHISASPNASMQAWAHLNSIRVFLYAAERESRKPTVPSGEAASSGENRKRAQKGPGVE
jgi:hypothetical protein